MKFLRWPLCHAAGCAGKSAWLEGFQRAVLEFLVNNDALSEGLRSRRLGWRDCGFSAHNEVRVPAEDAEGRKKFAGYLLRAPDVPECNHNAEHADNKLFHT